MKRLFLHLQRQCTLTCLWVDERVVVLRSGNNEGRVVKVEALAPVLFEKAGHVDDLPHDDRAATLRYEAIRLKKRQEGVFVRCLNFYAQFAFAGNRRHAGENSLSDA